MKIKTKMKCEEGGKNRMNKRKKTKQKKNIKKGGEVKEEMKKK